jgi:hypothetical protein
VTTQNIAVKLSAQGAQAVVTDIRKVAETMQRLDAASAIATRGLTSLAGGFRVLSGVAVTGGVVAGLTGIVRGLDALNDAADATGASLNKLAGLERLARINGGNLDQVTAAIVKLNQQLNGSDGSDSKAAIALKALGLEVDKLKQLDPADAIVQVGRALNQFADDGDKARLAQTLFGKSLRELAPLLKDIGESTGDYAVESAKAAQEAEKFAKNAARLGFVFEGLGRSLVGPVLEGLNAFIDRVQVAQRAGQGLASSLIGAGLLGEGDLGNAERALANAQSDLGRARNPEVRANLERRITDLNRQIVDQRRRLGLDQAAAPRPSVAGGVADAERAAESEKKLEGVRKASADAAKRLAEEERKRREGIAIELADQRLLIALVQQGLTQDEAQLRISLARKGLTGAEIEQSVALKAQLQGIVDIRKLAADELEAENKAQAEYLLNAQKQAEAVAQQVQSVEAQVKAQLEANETIGLTGVALVEVEAARLRDAAAEATRRAEVLASDPVTQAEAERTRELAAQYNKLADARLAGAVKSADIEKAKDAIEAQQREAQQLSKIFDDVGRSLTDSLFRGFEAGKGFARSFKDAIVNSFKSLVVRFIAQPVLSGITGSIAGAFGLGGPQGSGTPAAGGDGFSLLGAAQNIGSSLSGGIISSLGNLSSTFGSIGFSSGQSFLAGVSNSLQGGVGTFASAGAGSSAFSAGQFFGKAAPFLPAVFSALQGDFKGAALSAAGTAIGTALGGPIGGAIGSTIGSLVSGLIGTSGGTPHRGGLASASALDGRLLESANVTAKADKSALVPGLGSIGPAVSGIRAVGDALKPAIEAFAKQISVLTGQAVKVAGGVGSDGEDPSESRLRVLLGDQLLKLDDRGLKTDIKKAVEQFGKTLQGGALAFAVQMSDAAQFVKDAFGQFDVTKTDKLGNTVFDAKAARGIDPAAVQAVAQAVASLQALAPALASLNVTAAQVVATGKDAASLSANTAALQALLTPQELVTAQTDVLTKQFDALGLSLPSSAQGLRDLVTGIDKSTDSGQKLFGSVLGLVQPFLQLQSAIDGVNGSVQSMLDSQLGVAVNFATSTDDALARTAFVQNGGALATPFGTAVPASSQSNDQVAETRAMRQDLRDSQAQVAALLAKVNKVFARWDADGLPATRTVTV